jgi:WD40 repeat protein
VRLWETATGKPLVRHPGPEQGIARVVFSPDSKRVATASWGNAIHLWEAATGRLLRQWKLFGALAFTADGRHLVCGGWSDGKVRLLDLNTGKINRQFLAHAEGIRSMGLARDGKTIATAGNDGFLRLWDLATGRQVQDFGGKQKSFVFQLALSPDGKLVAAVHQDHAVRLWETATGKLLREHPEDSPGNVAFSPDGKLLASTFMGNLGLDRMIRVREVATGKEIRQLRGDGDPMDAVAFSPDGRTLIWGGQQRKDLYFWEIATGQMRRKFSGHQGRLTCVAFSPNGRMMASGGSDATVLIWDVTGQGSPRQPAPAPLSTTQLAKLWTDLAAKDAATAYQAICALREAPRQAVTLFQPHLKPVPRADAKRFAKALRNLDSERFLVRQQAAKEIEQMGEAAEPGLRAVLAGKPSVEVAQRVERLLDRLEPGTLRRSRALEVLEHIGDPPSRRLLTALAQGAPKARRTEEAQAALDRLGR